MNLEELKGLNYVINEDDNIVIENYIFNESRVWNGDELSEYEKWKSSFKRRIKIAFLKLVNRNAFEKLSMEQRNAVIIFDKTVSLPNAITKQKPGDTKAYVEYPEKNMLIVVDYLTNRIKIVNHIFKYVIDMNERMSAHINKSYSERAERDRDELEAKYDANVQNSLTNVINNIKNI